MQKRFCLFADISDRFSCLERLLQMVKREVVITS
jgi:hypothetical protein